MFELKYPVTTFYSEEDGGYIAVAPDLQGCSAFGETPPDAPKEIETTMELWLDVAMRNRAPIPEPTRMST